MPAMTSSNDRFDEAFKLFETTFPSFLEEFKRQDLVFCCQLYPQHNRCSFKVYENKSPTCHLQSLLFKGNQIKITPGKDLVYEDRLWFFYEQTPEHTKLQALMCYIDQYMPVYYVKLDEPIMSLMVEQFPKIPGIPSRFVQSDEEIIVEQPALF